MSDHGGQIILPAKVARGPMFVSAVFSYPLACDAVDVMDNGNLVTASSAHTEVNIALIGTVKKCQ